MLELKVLTECSNCSGQYSLHHLVYLHPPFFQRDHRPFLLDVDLCDGLNEDGGHWGRLLTWGSTLQGAVPVLFHGDILAVWRDGFLSVHTDTAGRAGTRKRNNPGAIE